MGNEPHNSSPLRTNFIDSQIPQESAHNNRNVLLMFFLSDSGSKELEHCDRIRWGLDNLQFVPQLKLLSKKSFIGQWHN